jgi:hypothetical protein
MVMKFYPSDDFGHHSQVHFSNDFADDNGLYGKKILFDFPSGASTPAGIWVYGYVSASQGFTGSLLGTSSWATNALTASTANAIKVTGENSNTTLRPLFTIGNSSANNLVYTDGNDRITFNPGLDILTLTGSLNILSGSITVTSGSVTVNTGSFIGNLTGTSSWAQSASNAVNAQTASYILNAISSSFASTASYVNPLTQSVSITEGLRVSKSDYGLIIGTEYASSSVSGNLEFVSRKGIGIYDSSLIIRPAGNIQNFEVNNGLYLRHNGYSSSIGTTPYSPLYFTTDNTLTSFGTIRGGILYNGKVFFGPSSFIGNDSGISMSADFEVGLTANFRKDTKITGSDTNANTYALRVTNTSGIDIFTIANNRKVGINFNTASLNESLNVSGNIKIEDGILIGTASWAQSASNAINAQTASFLPVATYNITASWAQSASNAVNSQTASFLPVGTYNITSSWAQSASNAVNAQTASFLPVATYNITASWAQSASNAINAQTASFLPVGTYNITASWATNALTASYVNPLRQNVLITGSLNITGGLNVIGTSSLTGSVFITSGALSVNKSGSTVVDVQGSQGTLFTITDTLSGSLFSVNDISGLPILEVFSDDTVIAGGYNQNDFVITGSKVGIGTRIPSDKLTVSGSINSITQRLTASLYRSESANLTTIGATSGSSLYESGFVKVTTNLGTISTLTSLDINLYKISSSVGYYRSTNLIEFTSASVVARASLNYGGRSIISGNPQVVSPLADASDATYLTWNLSGGTQTAFNIAANNYFATIEVFINDSDIFLVKIPVDSNFSNYTCSVFSQYEIFKT